MISERKIRRFQVVLLLGAGAVFAVCWFGYRTVSSWSRDLDKPTAEGWKRLVATAQGNPNIRALDEASLRASAEQMERAASLIQQAGQAGWPRVETDPETRARLAEEFQLLEFDRARWQVVAELRRTATTRKILVAEEALRGLPEFDPDVVPPSLHWAQLAFARQLMATALAVSPRAISNLTMLPIKTHLKADGQELSLIEFPMRVEVFGKPESLLRLLNSLPLRGEELTAAGLAEIPGKTQALFADRLILKNTAATPAESSLELVATGFCEPVKSEVVR